MARSLRLDFAPGSSGLDLISVQEVDMIAPPGFEGQKWRPGGLGQSGQWLEVRDADDAILYTRLARLPEAKRIEVPSHDPARPMHTVPVPQVSQRFSLVVPYIERARVIELFAPTSEKALSGSLGTFPFPAEPSDPRDPGSAAHLLTKVVDHGKAADRFNILLIAEGYRSRDMHKFACDAEWFAHVFFTTPPFNEFPKRFNIYRLDVESGEAGADDPAQKDCSGTNVMVDTYFDSTFCSQKVARLVEANRDRVIDTANAALPEHHAVVLVVNHPKPGGSGGAFATVTNSRAWPWGRAAIHELGHSAFGLADEYDFLTHCDDTRVLYKGPEFTAPNVSVDPDVAKGKWGHLVAATTQLPTLTSKDSSRCDERPILPGPVGTYEGAGLYHTGAFRPEAHCMMRNLSPFCAVCREAIRAVMAPFSEA